MRRTSTRGSAPRSALCGRCCGRRLSGAAPWLRTGHVKCSENRSGDGHACVIEANGWEEGASEQPFLQAAVNRKASRVRNMSKIQHQNGKPLSRGLKYGSG